MYFKTLNLEIGRLKNERLLKFNHLLFPSQVQELTKRLQKEICDHQLAQHRFAECEREKAHLKSELSSLEAIASRQDVVSGNRRQNELDPQRFQEHLKKMSLQLDLTNQRCLNYEAKNKSLEGINHFHIFICKAFSFL